MDACKANRLYTDLLGSRCGSAKDKLWIGREDIAVNVKFISQFGSHGRRARGDDDKYWS